MNDWISVKDRLPKFKTHVLCWDGENTFIGSRFVVGKGKDAQEHFNCTTCEGCVGLLFDDPTHWMPLPSPPKEK